MSNTHHTYQSPRSQINSDASPLLATRATGESTAASQTPQSISSSSEVVVNVGELLASNKDEHKSVTQEEHKASLGNSARDIVLNSDDMLLSIGAFLSEDDNKSFMGVHKNIHSILRQSFFSRHLLNKHRLKLFNLVEALHAFPVEMCNTADILLQDRLNFSDSLSYKITRWAHRVERISDIILCCMLIIVFIFFRSCSDEILLYGGVPVAAVSVLCFAERWLQSCFLSRRPQPLLPAEHTISIDTFLASLNQSFPHSQLLTVLKDYHKDIERLIISFHATDVTCCCVYVPFHKDLKVDSAIYNLLALHRILGREVERVIRKAIAANNVLYLHLVREELMHALKAKLSEGNYANDNMHAQILQLIKEGCAELDQKIAELEAIAKQKSEQVANSCVVTIESKATKQQVSASSSMSSFSSSVMCSTASSSQAFFSASSRDIREASQRTMQGGYTMLAQDGDDTGYTQNLGATASRSQ